jgi:hypothetical protein
MLREISFKVLAVVDPRLYEGIADFRELALKAQITQ